jgi:hypothetical protein
VVNTPVPAGKAAAALLASPVPAGGKVSQPEEAPKQVPNAHFAAVRARAATLTQTPQAPVPEASPALAAVAPATAPAPAPAPAPQAAPASQPAPVEPAQPAAAQASLAQPAPAPVKPASSEFTDVPLSRRESEMPTQLNQPLLAPETGDSAAEQSSPRAARPCCDAGACVLL